jgi:GNAT superfamily N-acetyltransferase
VTTSANTSEPTLLREATLADVPMVLRCIQGLAEYERLAHECLATEALLRENLFGPTPAAHVVLAMRGAETAGFALWFTSFSTFLARPGIYLEDLFVFPAFRGRGVGRTLLAHLAAIAIERGYARLEWSVLDWNVDAIRFYQSLGAVPMSEWTTYRVTGAALVALGADTGGRPAGT